MSEVIRQLIKRRIEVSEYSEYYSHDFGCSNCGHWQYCYVLRAHRLSGLDVPCDRCGCTVKLKESHG